MPEALRSSPHDHVAFDRLGRAAREAITGEVSAREHAAGKERLLFELDRSAMPNRRRWVFPASAASLVAAAAAIALWFGFGAGTSGLTWRVEGVALTQEGYAAPPTAGPPATLRFSDGSDVVFAPGSRGRIGAVSAKSALVIVESGRASARLKPAARVAWIIDVGPFSIAAGDAAVDVAWVPTDEVLDVHLRSGKAIVRGALANGGMALEPGQHLVAQLQKGTIRVEAETAAGGAPAAPSISVPSEPSATIATDVLDADSVDSAPAPAGRTPRSGWAQRVARGDFDGVLNEAQSYGIDTVLSKRPLADLVALADAARYRGRSSMARRVLIALRGRFPSSSDARTAAFLLGRMADDSDHSPSGALTWYDRYLAEAPDGAFASEALGRRMNAVEQISGRGAAKSAAQQYLRKYPKGSYAAVARDLAATAVTSP